MTGLVVVETSDLMLALGIKFWAGIIEKQNIQDLEECHHLINIIQDFLIANTQESQDVKEEVEVFLEKYNVIYGRYTFVDTDGIYRIPPTYYGMPL